MFVPGLEKHASHKWAALEGALSFACNDCKIIFPTKLDLAAAAR
jgi:hypothetical protein